MPQEFTVRHLVTGLTLAAAVSAIAGIAVPSIAEAEQPVPRGEIVFYVNEFAYRAASFDDTEVSVGKMGGPSYSSLQLASSGTWNGKVASFRAGGNPARFVFKKGNVGNPWYKSAGVFLKAEGNRITGFGTDVKVTKVDGGFRITGLWMQSNVDLTVTRSFARAQAVQFTSTVDGRYETASTPPLTVVLHGEAARVEDPPFPHMALAVLMVGWGVHPYP